MFDVLLKRPALTVVFTDVQFFVIGGIGVELHVRLDDVLGNTSRGPNHAGFAVGCTMGLRPLQTLPANGGEILRIGVVEQPDVPRWDRRRTRLRRQILSVPTYLILELAPSWGHGSPLYREVGSHGSGLLLGLEGLTGTSPWTRISDMPYLDSVRRGASDLRRSKSVTSAP